MRTTTMDSLEPRRCLAAGALDPTFGGGDGSVDVRINAHASWTPSATDAAVDGAGRALLGGVYGGKRNQFSVARLTAEGAVDATFGTNGIAVAPLPTNRAGTIAIVADGRGRVLVMISTSIGTTITRLSASGAPDKKFGKNGTAIVPFVSSAPNLGAYPDLDVDAGNNVVVIGATAGKTGTRAAVVRLTYRGRLDATFGGGGVYKTPVPSFQGDLGDVNGFRVEVLPDGAVIGVEGVHIRNDDYGIGGTTLFRLTANGTPDTSYGNDGFITGITTSDELYSDSYGFEGFYDDGSALMNSSGYTFEGDSIISDPYSYWSRVDPSGSSHDVVLLPDEVLSTDPDRDYVDYVTGQQAYYTSVLAFQPDGKVIVTAPGVATYRVNADGTYDASFVGHPVVAGEGQDWLVAGGRALSVGNTTDSYSTPPGSVLRVRAIALA